MFGRGYGYGRRGGGGWGRGRGWGRWGAGPANWDASGWEPGISWNQPLSALFANVPPAERKSWLENFKQHLERRMSEVNEELSKY